MIRQVPFAARLARQVLLAFVLLVGFGASAHATGGATPVITQIAAGYLHACALTTAGGVKCWGDGSYGQLGVGATVDSLTPVDVPGLTSGVVSLAAGQYHACALVAGVGVKCWGYNISGQLGNGNTTDQWSPVDVAGLGSGVIAIGAGGSHTCALTSAGGVKCWGIYVGDGTLSTRTTPVDVTGLTSGAVAVSVGDAHACAITAGGGAQCWGANALGQIGDGTTTARLSPVDVSGLTSGVADLSAHYQHSCALTTSGGVRCWGSNAFGQLGDGTTTQRISPVDVVGLASGVAALGGGDLHSCAVTTGGGLKCWGYNLNGQLGDGTSSTRLTPVNVYGLGSGVATVAGGIRFTCAVTVYGSLKCWGFNLWGQLGDGTINTRSTPAGVSGLNFGSVGVAAGLHHSCTLTAAGEVKCWGTNDHGQLGDATTTAHYLAASVSTLASGAAALSVGEDYSCAVTTDGAARCWGRNDRGQIGDGTLVDRLAPVTVSGFASGMRAIAPAWIHTCAVTTSGGAKCWGSGNFGDLGDGTTTSRSTPGDVTGLTAGVAAVASNTYNSCAVTTGGGLKCWGGGGAGQIGDGATSNRSTPTDVVGLSSGVRSVAVGDSYACALLTSEGVKCWGGNIYGNLGDGTTTSHSTPAFVTGLTSGVVDLATNWSHACAVMVGGGVKCWGYNGWGQLGDGTTTQRTTPVDVVGLDGTAVSVSVGTRHTCVVLLGGGVQCWGYNNLGMLGTGAADSGGPTPVSPIANGQRISFTPPDFLLVGTPTPLTATSSSSGLAVVFDTWTPLNCTVSGSSVTATSPAPCGIRASQPGDAGHMAAPLQMRLVQAYPGPPWVIDPVSAFVAETTANLGATIASDGATPIIVRGIYYSPTSVNANPFLGGPGVVWAPTKGTTGPFMRQVTGLLPNTSYSFRGFAFNISPAHSPVGTFKTASPAQINSFTASPVVVDSGGSSTLLWSLVGAATATLDGTPVSGPTGSVGVNPLTTTAYTLVATSASGTSSRVVTVTVNNGTANLAAPSITTPSDGQAVIVTGVSFSWASVSGATGYDLRVLDASTGAVRFSGSLLGAGSTSTLVTLGAGSYRFAVRACDSGFAAAQCGPWSLRNFTVAPAAPSGAPVVTFPSQGATLNTSTQTLSWNAVAPNPLLGGLNYEVLLTDAAAGLTVLQMNVPAPSTSTIFTMASSTQYELKVRACQADCGPWSTPVTFAVTLPEIPTSVPSINACSVTGGNSLTCDWGAVTNADTYQVLVVQPSGGPGGSPLTVAATQVSTLTVTLPVPAGAATVLVSACTGDGCGPSAQASINAAGPNAATPNLGTPMAGTVVNGPTVLFTWNRIPGDNGSNTPYRLYVQDLSRQAAALDVRTTQNFYSAYFKAEGARYDGLVIANPGVSQVAGAPSGFNVAGPSATAPTMVAPAHNSTVSAGNVTLSWTPVPGATLYEYYVAVQGQPSATVRGVTAGLLAQVPLAGSSPGIVYSGIVRACPWGTTCAAGVDTGWGPWSVDAGPGVTNFTVTNVP